MHIGFEKATAHHKEALFAWLGEPHVQEFWDNTQDHKEDILNFMGGRKSPSSYCQGKYVYWITTADDVPFGLIMTIQETQKDPIDEIKLEALSRTGHTYGIDYMIGNKEFLGKGYGALTLIKFLDFFRKTFDSMADTFLIDPETNNPRATHTYEKAGFEHIDDFILGGDLSGYQKPHHLMVKKFNPLITTS